MGIGGSGIHDPVDARKMTLADWIKLIPMLPFALIYMLVQWLFKPKE